MDVGHNLVLRFVLLVAASLTALETLMAKPRQDTLPSAAYYAIGAVANPGNGNIVEAAVM